MIRCCNCGAELSPRDAESVDGLPLSESGMLGHREPEICRAVNRAVSAEIQRSRTSIATCSAGRSVGAP